MICFDKLIKVCENLAFLSDAVQKNGEVLFLESNNNKI